MPYVILLRAMQNECWNGLGEGGTGSVSYPDVFSQDFDDHCAYLARSVAVDHRSNENLLGYSYVDAPSWALSNEASHVAGADFPQLKGLKGDTRENRLHEIATKYYATLHRHLRAYDANHLILGDLLNGDAPLPDVIIDALKPYVDVLAIQYFPADTDKARRRMVEHAARSSRLAEKPLYVPDIGNWAATQLNPHRGFDPTFRVAGLRDQVARGQNYVDSISALMTEPWFLGWHWCAYVENLGRGWGLKDPWDKPYSEMVERVTEFNRNFYDRLPF